MPKSFFAGCFLSPPPQAQTCEAQDEVNMLLNQAKCITMGQRQQTLQKVKRQFGGVTYPFASVLESLLLSRLAGD